MERPHELHEALLRRERYLEAVVEMQKRLLLTTGDALGAMNHVLEPLGLAAGASRVYLFENHEDASGQLLMSQRAEWCTPGIVPEIDNPQLQCLSYNDFFPRWASEMRAGRPVEGIVADFPVSEQVILEPQGILSIVVIPLVVEGKFTGFIGFDNCVSARAWDPLEVNLLTVAATNIGLMLDQRRTQRKLEATNAELAEARDRALDASRAKSTFLAKISHELRTPLNAIIGYSEILLDVADEWPAAAQGREDLNRIVGSGRHLLSVIDDLLDLSRAEAGKLRTFRRAVDADALVDDVAHATQHLRRRNNNRFRLEKTAPIGTLAIDETRMRQVLLNLLSNAFKYTSDGEVVLQAQPLDDRVAFAVNDTGIGMTADELDRVFDAFTQADDSATRTRDGTGLGLTITRHLCELMGAELRVTSVPGQGSRFQVTVPRSVHVTPS